MTSNSLVLFGSVNRYPNDFRDHLSELLSAPDARSESCSRGWEISGRGDARACSLPLTVTPPEEVRPMNAVAMWVLPFP